jgi:hypothetical protein
MSKRSRASIPTPTQHHLHFGDLQVVGASRTNGRLYAAYLSCETEDGRLRKLLLGELYWNGDGPKAVQLFEMLSNSKLGVDEIEAQELPKV